MKIYMRMRVLYWGKLQNIVAQFREASQIDPALKEIEQSIEKGMVQLEESAYSIRDYSSTLSSDSGTLEEVEDRIHLLNTLKRKYGDSIEEIIQKGEQIRKEVDNIEHFDERVKELTEESEKILADLLSSAKKISSKRKKVSKQPYGCFGERIKRGRN